MDHVNEKHEADPQKSTATTCQQIMQSPRHMNSHKEKLEGFEFWKKDLNGAKLIVAPMVDQSELAWRLLSRRHGAQLCYSPMYHAAVFVKNATYRKESLASCAEDRPLIVQFCANDPDTFLTAAKLAEPYCEAVDLNLGCPQAIAKRGHYGAFLQEEWDLVCRMVNICHRELKIPVTCKMRILEDMDKTVQNAKRLEEAGCQLLAVHGRRREQKGPLTGLADWKFIKAIKEALSIPVIANGNIQSLADVHRCIEETGVDGVMTAEGNLHNPCLLEGKNPPIWEMAEEYLALVDLYPCPASYIRGHLFKLFHHALQRHLDAREVLAIAKSVEDFKQATKLLKEKCMADVEAYEQDPSSLQCNLQLPYWLCQPYFRPSPEEAAQRSKDNDKNQRKRPLDVVNLERDGEKLSKNKLKKRSRNPNKKFEARVCQYEICSTCGNPKGMKCLYSLCKKCCRQKAHREMLDCPGHNIMFKTKHEKWLKKQAEENIGNSAKKDSPTELLHKCEIISNSEKDSAIS